MIMEIDSKMEALYLASTWGMGGLQTHRPRIKNEFIREVAKYPSLLALVDSNRDKIDIWIEAGFPPTSIENLHSRFSLFDPVGKAAFAYLVTCIKTVPLFIYDYARKNLNFNAEQIYYHAFTVTGNPEHPIAYLGNMPDTFARPDIIDLMKMRKLLWLYI